ncbi:MAG: D-alanyl-D-alanine carboxypeptidase family protein [Bacilli bacterium]
MFISASLLFANGLIAQAKETSNLRFAEAARSAVLIEAETGTVLYDKQSDVRLPPASMTKIMTMLLIMEEIQAGRLKLTDEVRASEYAASMGGSQIFLETGEAMSVHEMLKGIAIGSANDASMALAEHIAGSEDAFVERMNKRATALGLKNTHFMNPTGLPSPNHYSTAHDMAIMGQALLQYPLITKYTGLYEDFLRANTEKKFWLVNTNKLVKFYPGTDGLKTGFTQEAKYCLTATAKKNGMRVIAVIMGAPTPKERNAQITSMFNYAFSSFATQKLVNKGTALATVNVARGKEKQVTLVTPKDLVVVTQKGESVKKVTKAINVAEELKAPVKKGETYGTLQVKSDGKVLYTTPLVAKETVGKGSYLDYMKRTLGYMTKSE